MLDLIKTFIFGIWIEKKYRYIFLFLLSTLIYRFIKWFSMFSIYEMSPVYFQQINNDGSLEFIFSKKYSQTVYADKYIFPTKYGSKNKKYDIKHVVDTKKCEQEFFKLYENAVMSLINSSADKKFIVHFDKKFPKKNGDISYYDINNNEYYIYEKLYHQGFIFDKIRNINFCSELKKITK